MHQRIVPIVPSTLAATGISCCGAIVYFGISRAGLFTFKSSEVPLPRTPEQGKNRIEMFAIGDKSGTIENAAITDLAPEGNTVYLQYL